MAILNHEKNYTILEFIMLLLIDENIFIYCKPILKDYKVSVIVITDKLDDKKILKLKAMFEGILISIQYNTSLLVLSIHDFLSCWYF